MNKSILIFTLALASFAGNSQILFDVLTPSNLTGAYDLGYAQTDNGWALDMTDPLNAVTDTLVLLDAADDSACTAITNSPDVTGQIAVIYRGACAFVAKAKNVQDAGATGCVIINHSSGLITPTADPLLGADITIPVIVISMEDGATLIDSINNGAVTAYIGPSMGYYDNDLSFDQEDVLRAREFGNLQAISQSATDFQVEVGAWIYNHGAENQDGVTLTANITHNGSNIYTQVSTETQILVGDSAFINLPTFSQSTYANGYYALNYSVASDSLEGNPDDNVVMTNFNMSDDLYSYARIDSTTSLPIGTGGSRLGGTPSPFNFTACIAFQDENANGLGVAGITFAAMTNDPDTLTDKLVEVNLYEWNDVFTNINDAEFTDLTGIAFGEYTYTSDLQNEPVYVAVDIVEPMIPNQWYLGCVTTYGENVFLAYDNTIDYKRNSILYKNPMFPVGESMPTQAGFAGGIGEGEYSTNPPSIMLHFDTQVAIPEKEALKVTPFPNPTTNYITIPLGNLEGNASVQVFDMAGKLISIKTLSIIGNQTTQIDVSDIANGTYMFNLNMDKGMTTTFNVVINK